MSLQGIRFNKEIGELFILNQLLLPEEFVYEPIKTIDDGWTAIKQMKVTIVSIQW